MKAFIICLSILFLLTSCNPYSVNETKKKQNLILHISKPEGQNYTVYKKIEDVETVNTIMDVLQHVSWENAKVSMSREPDYKINTINIDPTVSYEPVIYAVWLSPMKDLLEVIIEGQSKYGKLTKQGSTTLLTIIETHDATKDNKLIKSDGIQTIKLACTDVCNNLIEKPLFTEHIFEDRNQIKAFEDAINSASKDTREVEYALLFQMQVTFNNGTQKKYEINIADDVRIKKGIIMSSDGQGYVIPEEITNELRLLIYKH